ncbi:hypothetical protein C8R43DRAFT_160709 [Mycena crocata]|nr:hypothetical protein C8R43DRAFT_160709 [Mycena crocata]
MAVVVGNAYFLVGSWINCMLFSAELCLMAQYFQHRSTRPWLHQVGVGAIFLFDTICTLTICAEVYTVVLVFPCQEAHVFTRFTMGALATELFTTYATASFVQLFLCYLYFALTKNRIVGGILVANVIIHLIFSYLSAIFVITNSAPGPTGFAFLTSKIGAITCAITDILIASVLLYTLIRMEITSAVRLSTHSLLRRLMVIIVTSGVLVASSTLFTMIFLLNGHPAYALFFFTQGRVYSLTIMSNFLLGLPLKPPLATAHAPGSVVSGVIFHVDYNNRNNSTDERTDGACDYNRRNDIDLETLSSPHTKSPPDSD